jgi:hypothetical protein
MKMISQAFALYVGTTCAVALLGCSKGEKLKGNEGSSTSDATAALAFIDSRPKVSAYSLDEGQFQMVGVRVGLQDYMSSSSPAITFMRPELADSVEILRCTKNSSIQSGGFNIEDVQIGSSTTDEQVNIFRSNDFWSVAEKANGCSLLASAFGNREVFIDGAAPSGGYRWIIRACVVPERLTDVQGLTTRNCSRQLGVSPVLEDYRNQRMEDERLALEGAMKQRDVIEGIAVSIYYQTVAYNNALVECNIREDNRAESVLKKRAIANIVGQGVGIAASLVSDYSQMSSGGMSAASIGQGAMASAGSSAAQTGAPSAAASSVGDKTVVGDAAAAQGGATNTAGGIITTAIDSVTGRNLGSNLTASINDLFVKSSDFERSCSAANRIRQEGEVMAQNLAAARDLFVAQMSAANVASQKRVNLESQ